MTEQKKDIFGFRQIKPGLYRNDEFNMTMTSSEFNRGLACALFVLLAAGAVFGGCAYAGVRGVRRAFSKPAVTQKAAVNPASVNMGSFVSNER